jgi:putative secretion ATPase (PEP-CTERM system associated)
MYERFFNLRERPFQLSPDPDYLYPSRVHQEALGYLRYGIESHAGFIVITGEIGCGKTTLLQTALRGVDQQTSVARLVTTTLDSRELIEAVMLDFGLDPGIARSKPYLIRDLAHFLVDQRATGRLALLVIDEAQNLSLSALEEIRMLSNLETEKSKLIQIALVGQPNLRQLLLRPELEQLRQRVTVSYHLLPLDANETAAYINHRLRRAALGAPLEFSRDVTDLIHLHSRGIPRKINVIADAVLLFGFGEDQRVITVDLTHEVLQELEGTGIVTSPTSEAATIASPASVSADAALRAREERLGVRERQLEEGERALAAGERALAEKLRLIEQKLERAAPLAMPDPPRPAWPAAPTPAPAVDRMRAVPPAPSVGQATDVMRPTWPAMTTGPRTATPASPLHASTPAHAGDITRRVQAPRAAAPAPSRPYEKSAGGANHGRQQPPEQGVWARLRRGLLGVPKPVFEE